MGLPAHDPNGSDLNAASSGAERPDLHIYYIEGLVEGRDQGFDHTYLGCWQEAGDAFLFFEAPAAAAVAQFVARQGDLVLKDAYQMPHAQWQGAPAREQRFGRFVLVPPGGDDMVPGHDRGAVIPVRLDPGLVFGNGTHTTTQDCLAALEMVCQGQAFGRVLDLGTGTGVLALAAAKMGCRKVLAIDLNRLATRTAMANVRLNHLTDRILVAQASALDLMRMPAGLVMANIHFDVMRRMVAEPAFLAHPWLILSGLLRSESRHIHDQLLRHGLTVHRVWDRDGIWFTLLAQSSPL